MGYCDYYLVQEEEEMLLLLDSEVIIIALRPMEYSTTVLRKVSELTSPIHVDCSLDKNVIFELIITIVIVM